MSNTKKIKVEQLRLGMFLHGFEGSWLTHPFWKSKFLLDKEADLAAVLKSGQHHCWIDVDKGLDVPPEAKAKAEAEAKTEAAPGAVAIFLDEAERKAPAGFDKEIERAAALCEEAREATMSMFHEARLGNAIDTQQCLPLVEEISDSVLRNSGALISLARLKTSDDYTYMHSVAVCALMVALARALGFDEDGCREAGLAGLLHDIGKAQVPLAILNKPGKLTEEEFLEVKAHPERGHAVLLKSGNVFAGALDVCLHHHEKMDGSGYPQKLAGEDISLLARMGAVCDVYDAITSNRPYKNGWDPAESVAHMISWKGHFDQAVLSAFIKTLGIYPTGALVKMKSGRLAVVLEQHPTLFTKPVVKVFFSTKGDVFIDPERIDLAAPDASDSIVGREPRAKWNFKILDDLWAGELAHRNDKKT